eukprot:TRINITY_DN5603_c0_g1_i1.p1 TRINITY_DN5603_c0_g1~~TRINITY_DN5603_c0_g1_i1.p1  ORF type:complete len:499 (+),score=101.91 TRINITY_DN5603_c0_g1_i1:165-1661(+)
MGDSDPLMEFITVTEAEPALAQLFLEKCNWDLQEAIQQYLEDPTRYMVDDGISAAIPADDSVRAPIEPRRMTLQDQFFEDDMMGTVPRRQEVKRPRVVFEHFADLRAEALVRAKAAGKRGGAQVQAKATGKIDRLAELFRPPYEIMQQGTFESVQSAAERREVWLLVNIQDDTEFDCQKLNRDVWKDAEVQKLIKSNFIFWQVRQDSPEGMQYMQVYPVARLPHIGIVDPRTGELLWFREEFLDPKTMAAELRKFLRSNSFDGDVDIDLTKPSYSSSNAVVIDDDDAPSYLPPTRQSSSAGGESSAPQIRQMSEEEMLEAAIKASLEDAQPEDHDDNAQEPVDSCDDDGSGDGDDDDGSGIKISSDDIGHSKKRKAPSETAVAAPTSKKPKLEETTSSSNSFQSTYPAPLEEDPSRGPKDCTIQLRLPNGTTMTKQFYSTDLVGSVAHVVQMEVGIQKDIQLKTMFPKKTFTEEELRSQTLADAKLTPRAVLIVEVEG